MKEEIIEKVIRDGYCIADKIRKAGSIYEINNLSRAIEHYCDYLNEYFGTPSDWNGEKECDLNIFLYVALDWKRKSLYSENANNPVIKRLAEEYMSDFIEELNSKSWVKPKNKKTSGE